MRIGFIAHEVHRRGGEERAAAEVIARLKRVHPVVVFSRVCELEGDDYEWVPIHGASPDPTVYGLTFSRAAGRAAVAAQCTVVYSVGPAALEADIVISQFCHAAFVERYGGIRGGDRPVWRALHYLTHQGFAWRERRTYRSRRLQRVLAVSSGVASEVMDKYGVPRDAMRVVPNGVDPAVFHPAASLDEKRALRRRLGLPEDRLLALFVGGDWHRKGVADVIEAVGMVPDVELVIVGRGHVEPFRQIAERARAADRVRFVPHTTQPQDYYAAADLFAFPSRYEAFSLATLEAAASGLPLLARRINGTEELVEHGVNGWFVEPGAPALAERIAALRDDGLRARMGAAALAASRRYTWDAIGRQHLDTLEELTHGRRSPR